MTAEVVKGRALPLFEYGYKTCEKCPLGRINHTDAEDCQACCEHALCVYHQGFDDGMAYAIDTARKAWDR